MENNYDKIITRLLENDNFSLKSEKLKKEVVGILLNLYNSDRKIEEKTELVRLYISNRSDSIDKEELKSLICNSMIVSIYSFDEQIKLINSYLHNDSSYSDIIDKCYKLCYEN